MLLANVTLLPIVSIVAPPPAMVTRRFAEMSSWFMPFVPKVSMPPLKVSALVATPRFCADWKIRSPRLMKRPPETWLLPPSTSLPPPESVTAAGVVPRLASTVLTVCDDVLDWLKMNSFAFETSTPPLMLLATVLGVKRKPPVSLVLVPISVRIEAVLVLKRTV